MKVKQFLISIGVPPTKYNVAHGSRIIKIYNLIKEVIRGVYVVEKSDGVIEFGKGGRGYWSTMSGIEMPAVIFTIKTITGSEAADKEIPQSDPMAVFRHIATPMMQYLKVNYHPHTCIMVTATNAEVLEGKMVVTNTTQH